jgi:hypothetical protein
MALEGMMGELFSGLPVEVASRLSELILVMKALGIAAILYIIYMITMGFLTYRRIKKVDDIDKKARDIDKKINSMNRKLDKLLKKR